MKKNQLFVSLYGNYVGKLEQTPYGKVIFTYDPSAKQAISLNMPIRKEPYDEVQTEAFFGGLLPESEITKKIIGKRYGVSSNNYFSLLKVIGIDCAGAISCHATNEIAKAEQGVPLTARIITEDELFEHIATLPRNPLFLDVDGLRLSLAGVQDKAAVCMIENHIALAENHCPTTHIIKPNFSPFTELAENEYFCLKIASRLGLPVPKIELRKIKNMTFLLIERYDRRIDNGIVARIHQEDFCQALGILSDNKYQNDGGPGFKESFELLNKTIQPAVDRNGLAAILVFNYLIGNMDAHGKNFSLLHHSASDIRLAPCYDMVCTRVYEKLTNKMAMKIGGKYDSAVIFPRHWEELCQDVQYRYLAMKKLILNYADQILVIANEEKEILFQQHGEVPIINEVIKFLENNIQQTKNRFLHD